MREAASLGAVDAYRAFNERELPNFLIHRGRYQEALKAALAMTRTSFPQSRAAGHALAGQAQIGLGRLPEAKVELDAARQELQAVPLVTAGLIPRRSAVQPWVEALEGEILLRTGEGDKGRAQLKSVQQAMRAIPGPDAWSQTLFRLESMARSAREVGDWDLAEFTAMQMLDHDAAYGGSHLAMALVLQHRGDTVGAAREFDAARKGWRDADPDLAELKLITTANVSEMKDARGSTAR